MSQPPQQPLSHRDAKAQARGAKAHAKALRPWWKKKRFLLPLALIALIAIISIATADGGGDRAQTAAAPAAPQSASEPNETKASDPSMEPAPEATKKSADSLSVEEQNAVESAQSYLSTLPFSRNGLIEQLSSDAGSGYPKKVATKAVDSLDVDWKEQAAKAAQSYMDTMSFSRQGLIEQLESDSGAGFTHEQAVYGAKKVGL